MHDSFILGWFSDNATESIVYSTSLNKILDLTVSDNPQIAQNALECLQNLTIEDENLAEFVANHGIFQKILLSIDSVTSSAAIHTHPNIPYATFSITKQQSRILSPAFSILRSCSPFISDATLFHQLLSQSSYCLLCEHDRVFSNALQTCSNMLSKSTIHHTNSLTLLAVPTQDGFGPITFLALGVHIFDKVVREFKQAVRGAALFNRLVLWRQCSERLSSGSPRFRLSAEQKVERRLVRILKEQSSNVASLLHYFAVKYYRTEDDEEEILSSGIIPLFGAFFSFLVSLDDETVSSHPMHISDAELAQFLRDLPQDTSSLCQAERKVAALLQTTDYPTIQQPLDHSIRSFEAERLFFPNLLKSNKTDEEFFEVQSSITRNATFFLANLLNGSNSHAEVALANFLPDPCSTTIVIRHIRSLIPLAKRPLLLELLECCKGLVLGPPSFRILFVELRLLPVLWTAVSSNQNSKGFTTFAAITRGLVDNLPEGQHLAEELAVQIIDSEIDRNIEEISRFVQEKTVHNLYDSLLRLKSQTESPSLIWNLNENLF
ncbi:hypothetical protein BLNAU_538 [Blattamonas nauphoetae]|uniref:Uncharacterized protein n=1 Tax=Blattamonas nauphoetae TaxID=2049346 RepID=A0ABQ9YLH9_9EUKA|nr:hypothetical protein BLNAU_538 [Blattamonas nauphoetae]